MTGSWLEQKGRSVAKRARNLSSRLIAEARADDFARAHASGCSPKTGELRAVQHFAVLSQLVEHHPLAAGKAYADLAALPWGRFSALDHLRLLLLHLPECAYLPSHDIGLSKADRALIVCPNPGATRTVVVFNDVERHLGAPLRLVHPWLWRLGVNVVYLTDPNFNYFLGPIKGLGVTIEEKAARIKQALRDLGGQPAVCIGNSGGGFGALLFAPLLGAERVLTYSPPTMIKESLAVVMQRLPERDRHLADSGEINIATIWQQHSRLPEVRIYFPGLYEHDRREAENMAGLAMVELCAIAESAEHNLPPLMVADGSFARHLEWLTAG